MKTRHSLYEGDRFPAEIIGRPSEESLLII